MPVSDYASRPHATIIAMNLNSAPAQLKLQLYCHPSINISVGLHHEGQQ